MSAGQLSPCSPKRSHLFFIGKTVVRTLSQMFSNVPKKNRQCIKEWIKDVLAVTGFSEEVAETLTAHAPVQSNRAKDRSLYGVAELADAPDQNPLYLPLTSCCPSCMREH
jgi:hypothetical protein